MNKPDNHTSTKMIAIIGAGPAGLMAAERLAGMGYAVHVYERMPSPARKFLMAGRGGLNITHSENMDDFTRRYGDADPRLIDAIKNFTPEDLRGWCHDLGQETFVGSSGRVFPTAMKASPLLRAWLQRLTNLGVTLHTRHEWRGWQDHHLVFDTPDGPSMIDADACLLALGGASWPRLGSDGGWVHFLSVRGVAITPFKPANCGFVVDWSTRFRDQHAGTPLKNISVRFGDVVARGDAMITRNGIEGGVIYAVSRSIRDALQHGSVTLCLDLRPDMSIETIVNRLQQPRRGQSLSNHLRRVLELSSMNRMLLHEQGYLPDDMTALARLIKAVPVIVSAPAGLARAISSAGGIRDEAIDDAGMLTACPGIFVSGEMLDWEAPTGGYLLQACFAHARMVAHGIDRWLRQQK